MSVPKKAGSSKRRPKKTSVKKASPKKTSLSASGGSRKATRSSASSKKGGESKSKKAKANLSNAKLKSPKNKAQNKTAKKATVKIKSKNKPVTAILKTKNKQTSSISNRPDRVKIKVFGVGGGGGNAISRMKRGNDIRGIEFIAINTDIQDLEKTDARKKIHIGKQITRGLGTGMNPDLGEQAAEESRGDLESAVGGADLIFITAGMGGGTGSGASPILAELAKEQGALTIAIVTKPFGFEGTPRTKVAENALVKLREKVDAIIVVPNDKVFEVIKKETPILKAFERIDDVLKDAIQGITELISSNGMINVDFSDIKTIMKDAGSALVGVGLAKGQNRAAIAANYALNSPLLEFNADGARGILFGISGGRDVKMSEINEIARHITSNTDPSAKIIFGAYQDRRIKKGSIKVTVIATGFEGPLQQIDESEVGSRLFGIDEGSEIIDLTSQAAQRQNLFQKKKTVEEEKEAIADEPVDNTKEFKRNGKPERQETENTEGEAEEQSKKSPWDIPAFLRKKKK